MNDSVSFDFGENWREFSSSKLDAARLQQAVLSLQTSAGTGTLQGHSFLDVGCGSGLFSIAAAICGASRVVGFDVNSTSIEVSQANVTRFAPELATTACLPRFCVGDILDDRFVERLGRFDFVYAWGSLHHTGSMWQAIHNAASCVQPDGGTFVVAIYNRHWTSPLWKQLKHAYNLSPEFLRRMLNYKFGALIYLGVWVTTRQNPLQKERGMDFWYDVVDWLGGYPYEYARPDEVVGFLVPMGFTLTQVLKPRGNTGCNQFVFLSAK